MAELKTFQTEQEKFWAGEFGNDYIGRNSGSDLIAANLSLFVTALKAARNLDSMIEFGSNVGNNIKALKLLYPNQTQSAVEINPQAASHLRTFLPENKVYEGSIAEIDIPDLYDLVLIKGVLIHINPDILRAVYKNLVRATGKYLLVAEYYSPNPVALSYRGQEERLYKRDFAGEIMDAHPEMKLVDYGFTYRRDNSFIHSDLNWFLLEKRLSA
jgi:pseudaminic acid biosynthesis-associated methylase